MDAKNEINIYLNTNVKDYQQGCDLLERFGDFAGRTKAAHLRTAPQKFGFPVLLDALRQLAGFSSTAVAAVPSKVDTLPSHIIRTKQKLHEYWLRLSTIHDRMVALGNDNTDEVKARRVALMVERQPYIDAFEQLYTLKEEYFALPDADRKVQPELIDLLARLDRPPVPTQESQQNTSEKIASFSDVELLRERDRVRKQISRRQNQLQFQADTRQTVVNPLPASPKRTKIENELAMLQPYFKQLDDEKRKREL